MKRKFSGWARLWLVVGFSYWVYSIFYAFNEIAELQGNLMDARWQAFLKQSAISGLAGWLIIFALAMLLKSIALWVWRGFHDDPVQR